jgi:ribonuclease G
LVNELFLENHSGVTQIALLSDKTLVEYHKESGEESFRIGDVYLAKVKRVVPGINAAFVDVGHDKDAFLHFHDLGPNFKTFLKHSNHAIETGVKSGNIQHVVFEEEVLKTGNISDYVSKGQLLMVQVAKEPIHNKGPRVSCDISFAGRFLVLIPFSKQVSVSKKIGNPEKQKQLKDLVRQFKPQNFGLIVRTVAEDAPLEDVEADLKELLLRWESCLKKLKGANHRKRLVSEGSTVEVILRDLLNDSFESIYVNDPGMFQDIKVIVSRILPSKQNIVKLHKGKNALFQHFEIDRQIKTAFGKKVPFSAGSYLIIEHTEALHVIDVNSGKQLNSGENQQEIALQVNLEAAKEIARQLRLRDMGGIIVIDFIDLKSPNFKKELDNKMNEFMADDKAKHTILPMSKFGLVQITRERLRPETVIITSEICAACNGTGKTESANLLNDRIEESLAYLYGNQNMKKLTLVVNPILKSYLTSGFLSIRSKWYFKFGKHLKIKADKKMPLGVFIFENESGEEVIL